MTTKPQRGGLRTPAGGRPPKPESERKVKVTISISPALLTKYPNEPLSQTVERLLRNQ